jgi:hypothetical protein
MANAKLRGFYARRKDLTVLVERKNQVLTPVIDKKGRPVIENGKPKMIKEVVITKEHPIVEVIIRCNNATPPTHKMLH